MQRKPVVALGSVLAGYVAIVSLFACYEDRNSRIKLMEESRIRENLRSRDIDLLEYAMQGANQGDPCDYVAASPKPKFEVLHRANGRKLISGREFMKLYADGPSLSQLSNGMPKIIHQTWWSRKVSEKNLFYSSSWLRCMPDWVHVVWDDDEARALYKGFRPDLLEMFDSYPEPVQRSDVFRYLVLQTYGGLYVDMDYECVKDISGPEGIGGNATVYMSAAPNPLVDGDAQNTLMASVPGDPFWSHVLWTLGGRCGRMAEPELLIRILVFLGACSTAYQMRPFLGWTGISVLWTTGPQMVSEAYKTYDPDKKQNVRLLPVDQFNGQADRGAKDGAMLQLEETFPCAPKAIHRNSAGWTSNTPFPWTGEHRVFGVRIPHRLVAILIIEVIVVLGLCWRWCLYFKLSEEQEKERKAN